MASHNPCVVPVRIRGLADLLEHGVRPSDLRQSSPANGDQQLSMAVLCAPDVPRGGSQRGSRPQFEATAGRRGGLAVRPVGNQQGQPQLVLPPPGRPLDMAGAAGPEGDMGRTARHCWAAPTDRISIPSAPRAPRCGAALVRSFPRRDDDLAKASSRRTPPGPLASRRGPGPFVPGVPPLARAASISATLT